MLRRISCCEHAVIHAPADGRTAYFTRAMLPGSLPHVLAGSASALDGFGTCSMFIPITACSLADSLLQEPFTSRAPNSSLLPCPPRLLPAGAKVAGWD